MLMEIGSMVLRQPAVPVSEITLNMLKQHEQNLSAVLKG
jgi:hypothetical protein